jgi:putative membrane protein
MLSATTLLATVIYAVIGIVVLFLAFVVVDLLTPGKMWNEIIEQRNQALATLAAGAAIGISVIIAAAVHG